MTTKLDPRRVEYLPLSALVSDPRNPKAHDQQTINDSIGRFGMLDPIVQDQRTGYIISGHGRHTALTQMESKGENQPEGIKVAEDGSWLVPVVTGWASRTDSEAHAALIALNRTTELGGWVDEELLSILEELEDLDDGLEGIGFSETDIDDLRAELEEMENSLPEYVDQEEVDAGTQQIKPTAKYLEEYDHQARRMMVLDYPVEEFREVIARLGKIRSDLGVDNNPDAVKILIERACPELPETASEETEDEYVSADENRDPAATL